MMRQLRLYLVGLLLSIQVLDCQLAAQSWELAREEDGITVYTRLDAGRSLKTYKGEAVIRAPADKVFTLIEDVNHTDWWAPKPSQIRVLAYERNKRAQYYLVYDSPWPLADRDLCVSVTVKTDPINSVFKVSGVPLTGVIPESGNRVRLKNFRQNWTITSAGINEARVVLEGYVDLGGIIPVWLSNMLVIESPINAIGGIKRRAENR